MLNQGGARTRTMPHSKQVPIEVARYLQMRIKEMLEKGIEQKDIARQAGVTKGQISTLANHAEGVGFRTLMGMGKVLGLSIDQIQAEAAKHPEFLKDADATDRYPARTQGAEFARINGVPETAIREVLGWQGLDAERLGAAEWFDSMRAEAKRQALREQQVPLADDANRPGLHNVDASLRRKKH